MFQSLDIDLRAHADRTFDSWEHGWRSLLLRRFTSHPAVEEVLVPPVAEQTIILVTRGVAIMESEADGVWRSARYLRGSIAMTAPNRPGRLRWRSVSAEPQESVHLHLPLSTTTRLVEELWDRDPRRITFPNTLATSDSVLEHTMLGLMRAAEDGMDNLYAETAAEFLAVHTLVRHGALPSPRSVRKMDERVRRARSFLRENLYRPLSLAEIAAEAGMSRYHFVRVFREQTSETPHRYLARLRIERAQDELKQSRATITEIASRCGFASRTHLATAFRRETGHAPSAYRDLNRG